MLTGFGADEVFEELVRLECGVESGWFGKLISCLALSGGAGAEEIATQLQLRDLVLWKAGQRLQRSGCNRFVDVAKALLAGNPSATVLEHKIRGFAKPPASTRTVI